ncbi:hypothetical protein D3C76_1281180 [compost metagenome]
MLGATFHACATDEPICEPLPAVKPRKPFRLTRGNRSAVATPTSAVLAARRRSAARISGRRRSNSLGSPMRIAVEIAGRSRGFKSSSSSCGGRPRRTLRRCLERSACACRSGMLACVAARRAWARSTSNSALIPAVWRCSVSRSEFCWFARFEWAMRSRSCAPRRAP